MRRTSVSRRGPTNTTATATTNTSPTPTTAPPPTPPRRTTNQQQQQNQENDKKEIVIVEQVEKPMRRTVRWSSFKKDGSPNLNDDNNNDDNDDQNLVESFSTTTTTVSTLRNKSSLTTIVSTRKNHQETHQERIPISLSPVMLSTRGLPPIVEEYLRDHPMPNLNFNFDSTTTGDGGTMTRSDRDHPSPPIITTNATDTSKAKASENNKVCENGNERELSATVHVDENSSARNELLSKNVEIMNSNQIVGNDDIVVRLVVDDVKEEQVTTLTDNNNNTVNNDHHIMHNNDNENQLTIIVPQSVNRPRSRSAMHFARSSPSPHSNNTPLSSSSSPSLNSSQVFNAVNHTVNDDGEQQRSEEMEDVEKQRNELNRERREFEKMKREFLEFMQSEKLAVDEERRQLNKLMKKMMKNQRQHQQQQQQQQEQNQNQSLGKEQLMQEPMTMLSPRYSPSHAPSSSSSDISSVSAHSATRSLDSIDDTDDLMTVDESQQQQSREAYDQMLKRLQQRKTITADIQEYREILCEDEQTSKRRASVSSKTQIAKEVSLLIGDRSVWSMESEQAFKFRDDMSTIHSTYKQNRLSMAITNAVLPPLYLTNDLNAVSQFDKKKEIMCKIFMPEINVHKTIVCTAETTATQLLEKLIPKMTVDNNPILSTEEHLFKASGFSSDFIYGDTPIIQFEHVWNCLKAENRVTLTVENWDHLWNELDMQDISLKSIDYQFSTAVNKPDIDSSTIISWKVGEPFRFKILGVENVQCLVPNSEVYISAQLFMGNHALSHEKLSHASELDNTSVKYGQYINFNDVLVSEIPREASLRILCYTRPKSSTGSVSSIGAKDTVSYSITVPVFNYKGELKSGNAQYRMWHGLKKYVYSENNDPSLKDPTTINIEFETRDRVVVYCDDYKLIPPELSERWIKFEQKRMSLYPKLSHTELLAEFDRIISTDPLYQLNSEEKYRLWSVRNAHILTGDPRVLFKFMQSVPWEHPQAIAIADQLVEKWEHMKPIDAIGLLNYGYPNGRLRRYAVKILSKLSDNELKGLLLQLVQTLKFELYHDSALARFLIERSLKSTHVIGHVLFWHMKSEMHDPCICERYGLILEEYLTNCGSHRRELLKQNGIVEQLFSIAMLIKETKKTYQVDVLKRELAKMTIPPRFKLPLSTRVDLSGILIDKCKVMNSKKLPLWLVFENAEKSGSPVYVIFKAGDDLRQDLLTLQMLNSMDGLWKQHNLNLRLNPYGCVCLGDMIGMIEVVLNSDTIANITHERGGASAAFSVDPLTVWLKRNCRTDREFENCVKNFVKSCAGYCVATYVLGIGDRHNDNIMLTRKGDLFHIDFGHFLGNFKSFKGIYKRETTPFVFTPMYAHVMGGTDGEDYKQFVKMGCEAFLLLRNYGHMLMNLFLLMLPAGIPELSSIEDIEWLRKVLQLDVSEEQAMKHFEKQIKRSLGNTRARINDAVHIYAKK